MLVTASVMILLISGALLASLRIRLLHLHGAVAWHVKPHLRIPLHHPNSRPNKSQHMVGSKPSLSPHGSGLSTLD